MAITIADLVEHAVDACGERTAVLCGDRSVTYAELEQRTNRLAHHMQANGVTAGSHVGVYGRNSIELIEAMIAAYKLRAVAININYRYVENELRYLADNADLCALVYDRALSGTVASVVPGLPKLRHQIVIEDGSDAATEAISYDAALEQGSPERDFGPRSPDDHYILYTGGTTGMPKGVVWRQEDIWRALGGGVEVYTGRRLPDEWEQSRTGAENPPLVTLPIPPLIHGATQWASLRALFSGGAVVMLPDFSGHAVWELVQRHKVNVLLISGDAMGRPMIEAVNEREYDISSVVAIASSAALFSASVKNQFLEKLPNAVLTDSIGSSETGFTGLSIAQRDGVSTVGPRVIADEDAVVIDDDGNPVAKGETGRLARRNYVPIGYYKDEKKSAEVFVTIGGERYTVPGDFACLEEDGTITLLGRGSTCVNTAGEKVYPEEVESALKAHPAVFDTLVIGIVDERLGQRVAAVIAARQGDRPGLTELNEFLRERIAGYKVPRSVWFADSIRRTPSGKPDYAWAKEFAAGREPDDSVAVTAGKV
ncbi:acyl-CoA synthetase [Sciscionella marina]|uniref:acyl-CoA synthetase n=1 Tax=Sciscionella marina TaxID=508770 RepID=UPI0003625C0D|nr:acyl-CoA synthetase [Sciscionella marina]